MESLGQLAGLAAAMCWAISSVLYARVPMGAGAITTYKNTLGALCLLCCLPLTFLTGSTLFTAKQQAWWDIGWSGILGLYLADVAYFRSIQILGARRGLTLTLLTPPAIAVFGQIWLGEQLTQWTWQCIALTLVGIAIVMWQKAEKTKDQNHRPGSTAWGIACSLTGITLMAVGAIYLKRGTAHVNPIEGTFVRLLAASLCGIVFGIPQGEARQVQRLWQDRRSTRELSLAALLGTVIGVSLMLISYKYCQAGIAATLTSTSPLFVIPVVYVAYREKITGWAIVGVVIAFGGVVGLVTA